MPQDALLERTLDDHAIVIAALPYDIRADVATVNVDARTAEVVFTTEAPVERFDWRTGKQYFEILSMKPEHVDLRRINAGAPLLDSHSTGSVFRQLGAVVRGSARVSGRKALATIRFSQRAEVEPIFQDVRDGITTAVSVGYRVSRFEESEGKAGAPPTRLATWWMPYEISLVSMPSDIGASVREGDRSLANRCVIVPAVSDADRRRQVMLARAKSAQGVDR
jgi:hypothetical protein